MPQAYLALHDDKDNCLITQKRLTNNWWQGSDRKTDNPHEEKDKTTVNQAGQYSLPGGRINNRQLESPRNGAVREFQEETGVSLWLDIRSGKVQHIGSQAFDREGNALTSNKGAAFYVVRCQTTAERLNEIHNDINKNVMAAEGKTGPAGGNPNN